MNATIAKFGYPATLLRDYRHWVLLLRPTQVTAGSMILAAKNDATAYGDLPEAAFTEQATVVADVEDLPSPEQAEMATYLSMPLRGHGGAVVGVLALSSAVKNAFGETALSTLKLIEGPAAIVIDNARLSGARAAALLG